jgi:hypothetical protein
MAFSPAKAFAEEDGVLLSSVAEPGASAPPWTQTWEFSRSVNGYAGSGYFHRLIAKEPAKAAWTLRVPQSGLVTVAARWTADANRTTNAKFVIEGAKSGAVEVRVDQTRDGGEWIPLANVQADAGAELRVSAEGTEEGKRVVANAVALLRPSPELNGPGLVYGTPAAQNPFTRTMNIAPWSRVTAHSWLENMTPDMLVDGDTRFVYRQTGWRSGTRFAAPSGYWKEEPLIFDFGRTERSMIEGVEVFSRTPVQYAVDVSDGGKWLQVAENQVDGKWPQRISFAKTEAHSVRVRLLRHEGKWDTEHYLLGEVRIFGRLRGENLVEQKGETLKPSGVWIVEEKTPLQAGLNPVPSKRPLVVSARLTRPYDDQLVEAKEASAGAGARLNFGVQPAGVYRVELVLRDASSGAVVERKSVDAGVRNPGWAHGEVAAFVEDVDKFKDRNPQPNAFFRSADINGLDSYHELTDLDFFVQAVAKAGAVAEFHLNWRSLEPLPGVYDFSFSDRIFKAAASRGVYFKFMLNPPLTGYVPEFLKDHRMETQYRDGHREVIDMVSLASPLVQEHAQKLFTVLFKRYGQHPAALMWVLNVNGEYLWRIQNPKYEDASEWSLAAYRRFLEARYGTVDALNRKWDARLASFQDVERPSFGANVPWADFCDFMMNMTADFYRPIAESARRLTHPGTILLFTAGHQAAEPIIGLARDYDIWQSNHSQENPHFIGWAEIWRSLGVTRFGEPGFVNIEPLDVNRAFFNNAVGGARMYTYRQYNWPNDAAWSSFSKQQAMGDLLRDAEPMRVPLTLVSTYESGLVGAANSFAVGGTWTPTGAFYDALLKRGAIAAYYDGHNARALEDSRVIVDLGSQAWTDVSLDALASAVKKGAQLKVLPSSAGRRFLWGETNTGKDVLLEKFKVRQESSEKALIDGSSGLLSLAQGSVEVLGKHPPYGVLFGNNRRDAEGTGWNIQHTSPELLALLDRWVTDAEGAWPFKFESDATHTWVCGFVGIGGRRFVLVYNNESRRAVTVTVSLFSEKWFPANTYRVVRHTLTGSSPLGMIQARGGDVNAEVPPYELVLLELTPES